MQFILNAAACPVEFPDAKALAEQVENSLRGATLANFDLPKHYPEIVPKIKP